MMSKIKYSQQNEDLENTISELFAQIIAKKIYHEFGLSFKYETKQDIQGSLIYKIYYKGQIVGHYCLNQNTNYRDCLKILFLGIHCRHLFCLWKCREVELIDQILKRSNQFWVLKYPDDL